MQKTHWSHKRNIESKNGRGIGGKASLETVMHCSRASGIVDWEAHRSAQEDIGCNLLELGSVLC